MLRGGAKHKYKRQRLAKNSQEDHFGLVWDSTSGSVTPLTRAYRELPCVEQKSTGSTPTTTGKVGHHIIYRLDVKTVLQRE